MQSVNEYKKYLPGAVAGGAVVVSGMSTSVLAEATVPDAGDVTTAIQATGAVGVAATAIVLGVMGVRIAIKLVNRLSAKG